MATATPGSRSEADDDRRFDGAVSIEAAFLLVALSHELRTRLAMISADLRLTERQGAVLYHVDAPRGTSIKELAARLHCDPANLSTTIDKMQQGGFVGRHAAGHDRRVSLVFLTKSGNSVRKRLLHELGLAANPLTRLSENEQLVLHGLLRQALGR